MKHYTHWIEDYLKGNLSAAEQAELEAAMAQDPNLAAEVAEFRATLQRLDALRIRQKVQQALSEPPPPATWAWQYLLIAGLLLLLSIAVGWYFLSPKAPKIPPAPAHAVPPAPTDTLAAPASDTTPDLAQKPAIHTSTTPKAPKWAALASRFQQDPAVDQLRSTEPASAPTLLDKAIKAYEQGQFALAIASLPDTLALPNEDARYLRASAYLRMGNPDKALADYTALRSSFQYRHEARFHLALCQLAQGKEKEGQLALQKMAAEPNFPFQQTAIAVLNAMK